MQKILAILTVLAVFPAGRAVADDDCFVPMANWQPRDAVAAFAADHGWTVRRIKIDDGCYEIDGTDTTGRRIEVRLHPASLQVLEMEYEDGDEDEDEDDEKEHRSDDEQGQGDHD